MQLEQIKAEIIMYGKKLVDLNLTSGTGGNISVYDEENQQVIITPSGFDFYEMTEADLVIIDLDGKVIHGNHKPSSEWEMHTLIYKERSDIKTVIHAHTIYATVLACLRLPLLPTHYMVAVAGSDVRVSEYATFGTTQIAINALTAMKDRKAVILANHGLIGGEQTLNKAFNVIEEVEYCAKIYCLAMQAGKPIILPDEEMAIMAEKFQNYGKNVKKES